MPLYEIEIPGRGKFQVESPTPLTDQQAYAAIIQQIGAGTVQKPAEGVFAALGKGAESALSAARAGVKGIYAPEEAAREAKARGEDIGKRYADQVSLEKVKEAYEKRGLLPAAGEALSQIPYAIAEQGANIGTTLAGARVGAMAGSPFGPVGTVVGGLAGAALPSFFQQAGGNIQRQAETGQPIDRAAAYGAAAPQAALDVAGTLIPLGRTVAGKVFGPGVAKLLERGAEEGAERLAKESLTKVLAKGTAVGALAEVPTEVVQQMLERAQAGLSLTSTDAIKEYGETMYQTALLAPIGAAGRVAERGQAREIVEERQQKTLAEQAKEKRNAQLAAEEAEEARKQSPEYAQTFATQHEALQQEYNDLTATLKQKLPKGASFADKQTNKDLIDRRKELAEQLKEQAPEYNRVMGVLKPIRDQEAAAAQQAEAQRAQAETQRLQAEAEAQQRRMAEEQAEGFAGPMQQLNLPGAGSQALTPTPPEPTITAPMPEAEAPVDYASQVNNLRNYLDEIRTRAQGTTDLDAKLQLGEEYARVQAALKEAETLSKTAGKSADKQVDLLRKKMAVAEEEGDIDTQVKLAKQLKDLGLTDLAQATTQADLGLGKPQELSKLQVPTDLEDARIALGEKMGVEREAAATMRTQGALEQQAARDEATQVEAQRAQEAEQFRQAPQLEMFAPAREQVTRTVEAPRMSAQAKNLQSQIDALEVRRAETTDRPERAVALDRQIGELQAKLDALAPEVTETRRVAIPPQEPTPVTQPAPALTKQINTLTERVLASPRVDEETKAVVQQIQADVPAFIRAATARAAQGATEMRQRAATAMTQGPSKVVPTAPAEVFTPEQTAAWLYRTLNSGRADPADTARVRGVLQSMETAKAAPQPELPGVTPKPAPAPAPAAPISTLATREATDAAKRREEQARLERAEAGPRTLVQFEQQTGETLADEQYTKLVEAAYNPRLDADARLKASEQADAYLQQKLAKLEAAEAARPALIQKKQADLAAAEQRLAKLNERLQGVKLTTREKAKAKVKSDTAAQEQILEGKRAKLQAAIKTEEAKRDKHQRLLSTAQSYPKVTRVDPADLRAYREELNAEILRTRTPGERLGVAEGTQQRAIGPVTRPEVIPPKTMRTGSEESRAGLTTTDTRQRLTEARGEKQRDVAITKAEQAKAEEVAAPIREERKARAAKAAEVAAQKAAERKQTEDEAKARLKAAQSKAPKAARKAKVVAESEELEAFEPEDLGFDFGADTLEQLAATASQGPALKEKVDTEESAAAVAANVADNGSTDINRAIGQRLKLLLGNTRMELVDDLRDPDGAAAYGQAAVDGSFIRLDKKYGLNERTFLHEGTHAAVERVLRMPEDQLTDAQLRAKRELQELFEAYKKLPNATNENAKTSLSEFASEALSDDVMQSEMRQQKWTLRHMWDTFKSLILDMLGVKTPTNMLDATLASVDNLMTRVPRATVQDNSLLGPKVLNRPRNLNPALAGADDVARRVVAGNRSWWQTVKANTTGLGFETQAIDRFAGLERLSKYLPRLQGTQMMYYLRMYDQRMNFVSQSAVNGALDLREVQRKDGEREFLIESQDGTSLRSVVTTLKRATPMVGNADATSRLFTLYVAANRAKRVGYDKLDLSGQVTEQELKDTLRQVDSVPGLKDVFETARDQYNEYNEGLVRFAQKTGVFSKEYADKLLSAKDYIPWYRSRNGVVELVIGGEAPFKVGNVKDMPHLAELVGGDKPILDFTISSVQNTNMLVDMSLRNLATKNAVMELVDLGAAKVTNKPISGTDVVKFRVKGEDRYAILDTETIKINGQDVNTGVPADLLVKGMEGIPVQLTGVMRAMAMPTNVLRKAITLMPPYMLRQIVRDSTHAFIASGADITPVMSALREIGSAAGKKLERRGIVGGQMFTGTTEDISQIMREIVSGGNLFNASVGKLEALGMEADALTRRAQYNSYIKQGMSEMEATLLALESMNFNKRGASPSIHFANSMIPFFNAQVQGLNVLYRAMFGQITAAEKARIKQKLITRGMLMFAVSLAYTHAMQDDEAYKNALPEDKYGNWFVRIPGVAEPLRVPIPFELGYIFKALPEALYNTIVNKHGKEDAAQAFKSILRNTIPGGSSMAQIGGVPVPVPIPQVFKPAIEVAANFSFFTGRDVVSAKEQLLLPEYQYREQTTELAKLFGGAGVSPIKFEALIRGYLGGAGMAVLGALSLPLVKEGPEKATKRMSDMPVVGTMFQPNDARWIINNAFDQLREAQQVQASFKDLVNKGERAEAKNLLETRATDYARAELGGYLRQQMGELTQLETAIKASNKTSEEKRKLLDQVQQTRIKLAGMVRDASDATKLRAQAT